jgi:Escherichia/Staphylococcus phage prohead protease
VREDLEFRSAVEVRTTGKKLVGYAAVFDVTADIGGRFREVIRAGSFTTTLATGADVLCLVDHDAGKLLGRTSSKTLRLSEDTRGLAFELDTPDTALGRDILTMAARNDLGGMSFAFRSTSESWTADVRELRSVDLIEVSVVQAWPAYPTTSIGLRSRARLTSVPLPPAARQRIIGMA